SPWSRWLSFPRGKSPFSRSQRLGNSLDHRQALRSREALRDQLLDFGLALVRGRSEQVRSARLGEMRREQGDRAQVQLAIRQGGKDDREAARRPARVDALESGLLTQV